MNTDQLYKLQQSAEAPADRDEYTVWLHNKIVEAAVYEIWNFREKESTLNIKSGYVACNKILTLQALQIIK